MRTTTKTTRMLPLGAVAVLGLASCSLPPSAAWREIRQDGLITYLMRDDGSAPAAPTQSAPTGSATQMVAKTNTPSPMLTAGPPAPTTPPPSQLNTAALPTAQQVPGLDGYVRSPFTNPPRLVDVRGMNAGSKVVCPYTRRPFLVPNMVASNQAVASTTPTVDEAPAPVEKNEPKSEPAPEPKKMVTAPIPDAPTKVAANTAPTPQPPPAPVQPKPMVKTEPNAPAKTTPPVATPPKPAAAELPFGVAIPGRPGFVNSPYAAKHQLVDVTGLPTGMEVKCPYTGKLFRVPPQANNQ